MRKLSITLAVMSILAPPSVGALGIGDIRLRSSLNQTFSAEIPLVTSGSESIADVKVSLASPEAFSKAGVERHYSLSKLRFNPTQKPDGSYVIKVSSQDIIREPFMNFLVEVNWPQGRMLREFTVLLDPPSTFKEETIPSTSLPESTRQSRRPTYTEPEAEIFPRRSSVGQRTTAAAAADRIRGSTFGPVRPEETLWSIARLINQEVGATQEQVMTALYQANPQAFIRNNIHALKAGETLTIPSREAILSVPVREAKAHLQPPPSAKTGRLTEQRPEPAAGTATEGQLPGGQLKLLAPSEIGEKQLGTAPGAKEESGKAKGDIALEVADTVKQENEEIRSRLSELEQQLSSMQRLLTLKDEQIADLQSQRKSAEPKVAPSSAPEGIQAEMTESPAPASTTPGEVPVVGEPVPATSEAVAPKVPPASPPVPVPSPSVVKPPQPTEEPGLLAELLDEPLLLALTGITSALLLGILAWLTMRRRAAIMDEAESILAPSVRERIAEAPGPTPIMDGVPTEQIVVSAKSSFLSEFTPSDFDALGGETDEVDPISEADVYLAYGRYKQAEDLIRGAIAQYPARDECKLKLLEIHYATENRSAFESYANELFKSGKDAEPDFWDKVVEMGRELCPGNPLFTGVADIKLDSDENAFLTSELQDESSQSTIEDDFIAELKRFEESKGAEAQSRESQRASFDFEEDAAIAGTEQTMQREEDKSAPLSFDFTAPPPQDKKSPTPPDDQEISLELDNLIAFERESLPTPADQEAPSASPKDKTLDDILSELGAKPSQNATEQAGEPEKEPLEFTLDLDFAGITPPQDEAEGSRMAEPASGDEEGELYSSLTDMDEQETKLDLAKAYIDMGDDSTAREILNDVLSKGTEAQKIEAGALLTKLDKSKTE